MYKKIPRKSDDFITLSPVEYIYSMTECLVKEHPVHGSTWMNECLLANAPQDYSTVAEQYSLELDVSGYTLMYYTMFEYEADAESVVWSDIPAEQIPRQVREPTQGEFLGYDLVGFFLVSPAPPCLAMEWQKNLPVIDFVCSRLWKKLLDS